MKKAERIPILSIFKRQLTGMIPFSFVKMDNACTSILQLSRTNQTREHERGGRFGAKNSLSKSRHLHACLTCRLGLGNGKAPLATNDDRDALGKRI